VNPAAGQILADTGPLGSGDYTILLFVDANPTGIEVLFEQTDTTGAVVQKSQIVPVTLAMLIIEFPRAVLRLQAGERLVVVNRAAVPLGTEVQAGIFTSLDVIR
jgi:hypothetical protein